jgi:hypothetical protein
LLLACLINLLPESFDALSISVWALLQHFWELIQDLEGCVFMSLLLALHSWPAGRVAPARCHQAMLIWGEGAPLLASQGQLLVAQRNLERLGNQLGSPAHQTGKNLDLNSGLPRRQEGSLINSQRDLSNPPLGWNCLSGSGSRVEVLCYVRVCESESLRHSLVTKWVWSPNLWVHGEFIWFRVSPNKASGLGLIQTHYSQETPKPP